MPCRPENGAGRDLTAKGELKHEHITKKRFDDKIRKYITMVLAFLLLCLPLGGCKSHEEESRKPKTMAEAQIKKAQASAAAQEQENETQDILRVVTDIDCRSKMMGRSSQASQGKQIFQTILKHFGGVPSGMEVELNLLPMDEGGAYDSELTHIRTELAAGAGPDVFLMSGFGYGIDSFEGETYVPKNTLFQNPESAMKKGLFLPLDDYIPNARFMDFDKLDPTVMAAGRNDQGQVVLPMFYQLDQAVLVKEADPGSLPGSWGQGVAMAGPDEYILEAYGFGLRFTRFRNMCFGQVADNQKEELLLDQETFFQRCKEAVNLYAQAVPRLKEVISGSYVDSLSKMLAFVGYWTGYPSVEDAAFTSFVFHNEKGQINAPIETWCAVNKNTKHPDDAFFIVDCLLSKDFLSQEAFWIPTETYKYNSDQMTFFYMAGEGLVPVHTGLLSNPKGRYKYIETLGGPQRELLKEARESIGYAYFTSNVDREIDRMMAELMTRVYDGEALTDEDICKACDKCYTTLKMMLAES